MSMYNEITKEQKGDFKMKNYIICKRAEQAKTSFYLVFDNDEYYLFTQNYRKGVKDYFMNGVTINEALDKDKGRFDSALMRTMEKMPAYIKYIEKEYGIMVLRRTKKKEEKNCITNKVTGSNRNSAFLNACFSREEY